MLTPEQRSQYARLAALTSWGITPDRAARTAAARKALADRFEAQVPAEITDPATRAAAAENLRRAYYLRLALASAKARKAKAVKKRAPRSCRDTGGPLCAAENRCPAHQVDRDPQRAFGAE